MLPSEQFVGVRDSFRTFYLQLVVFCLSCQLVGFVGIIS